MALSRIAIALKSVASVAFIAAGGHRLLPRAARHTSWSRVRVRPGPTAERMAGYPMTGACDGVATARLASQHIPRRLVALHSDYDGLRSAIRLAPGGVWDQRGPRCCA